MSGIRAEAATTEVTASPVATTVPTRAYEPRVAALIMTGLTLDMPIGSQARRFQAVHARAARRGGGTKASIAYPG
ncbi:hypothetical protein [Streptomyces sp. NPDC058632]|uniref:hypothetical protein n=1 Tax=Streptomyces sp. NPDC058632 TaxID=3346567 RepID=UPI00366542E9